jgi:hypothetical protein
MIRAHSPKSAIGPPIAIDQHQTEVIVSGELPRSR